MAIGEITKQGNWGWCVHCEKAIDPDVFWKLWVSNNYKCPFDGCEGTGIGIDLWEIGADDTSQHETWPTNETPTHGAIYPLYNSVYDATQEHTKFDTKLDSSEDD